MSSRFVDQGIRWEYLVLTEPNEHVAAARRALSAINYHQPSLESNSLAAIMNFGSTTLAGADVALRPTLHPA